MQRTLDGTFSEKIMPDVLLLPFFAIASIVQHVEANMARSLRNSLAARLRFTADVDPVIVVSMVFFHRGRIGQVSSDSSGELLFPWQIRAEEILTGGSETRNDRMKLGSRSRNLFEDHGSLTLRCEIL